MAVADKAHTKALAFVRWLFDNDKMEAAQFFDASITDARAWWDRKKFVPFFQALATAYAIQVDIYDFTRIWSEHSRASLEVLGKGLAKDWLINETLKQGSGANRVHSLLKEDPLYLAVLMLLHTCNYDLQQWASTPELKKLFASIKEACEG